MKYVSFKYEVVKLLRKLLQKSSRKYIFFSFNVRLVLDAI